MNAPFLLLASADPGAKTLWGTPFRERGCTLLLVDSTAAALAAMNRAIPDLVLLDELLSDRSGFDACALLRMYGLSARVPVILLSSRPGAEGLGQEMGANLVLPRQVEPAQLLSRSMACLDASVLHDAPRPRTWNLVNLGMSLPEFPLDASGGTSSRDPDIAPLPTRLGGLARLLMLLFRRGFDGTMELRSARGNANVYFLDGHPAGLRGQPSPGDLRELILEKQLLEPACLHSAWREAMLLSRPFHAHLVASRLLGPHHLEWLQKELVLRAVLSLRNEINAQLYFHHDAGVSTPAYPVHVVALLWRMAGLALPMEPIPHESDAPFVRADPSLETIWPLLDPHDEMPALRMLIIGGATLQSIENHGDPRALPLVCLLYSTELIDLAKRPSTSSARAAALGKWDPEPFRNALQADYNALVDADPCTLMGFHPEPGSAPPSREHPVQDDCASLHEERLFQRYGPLSRPPGITAAEHRQANCLYRHAARARWIAQHAEYSRFCQSLARQSQGPPPILPETDDRALFQAERAFVLMRRGEYVVAASMLSLALQLEGDDSDVLALLGWARHLAAPGDTSAGERELRQALRLDPGNDWASMALALLLHERSSRKDALEILRSALMRSPSNPATRYVLACLENAVGATTRAGLRRVLLYQQEWATPLPGSHLPASSSQDFNSAPLPHL